MKGYFAREIRQLIANLRGGILACAFRRRSLEQFQYSIDQAYWLLGFGLLLALTVGRIRFLPQPDFSIFGLYIHAVRLALTLAATFLIAKMLGDARLQLRLLITLFSVYPVFYVAFNLFTFLYQNYDNHDARLFWLWASLLTLVWSLSALFFVLYQFAGRARAKTFAAFATLALVGYVPLSFLPHWAFWAPHRVDNYARNEQLYGEQALYLQDHLVRAATRHLLAGTSGRPGVYFVGFAGFGEQDVFMKEVKYAKHLFESRFDTRGRDVVLINNIDTFDTVPMATKTNLERVLMAVGHKMKPGDFLFLYMTSHGSSQPSFAVDMPPYDLYQISPKALRTMLDRAGIRNRVLMISACYSGGFVAPLQNANTVVITAAAADRTSFGCSNESNFTYFGEALLADEMQHQSSILSAFHATLKDIYAREEREHLEHSNPQLFVGQNMITKLRALDRTLTVERTADRMDARAPLSDSAAMNSLRY